MKTRSVQTRFWDDEFISESDVFTQHLYIYLLTCQYINLSGMFQLPVKKIMLETKLTDRQFSAASANLEAAKKVIFFHGWVCVANADKNNSYVLSPKNIKPLALEQAQVPEEVKKHFIAVLEGKQDTLSIGYPVLLDTTRNQKPETHIRNQKPETQRSLDFLTALPDDDVATLKEKYNLDDRTIRRKAEDLHNWCLANGKKYQNYYAFLASALSRDADQLRQKSAPKVRHITDTPQGGAIA